MCLETCHRRAVRSTTEFEKASYIHILHATHALRFLAKRKLPRYFSFRPPLPPLPRPPLQIVRHMWCCDLRRVLVRQLVARVPRHAFDLVRLERGVLRCGFCRYASNNQKVYCRTHQMHSTDRETKLSYSNWIIATRTTCPDCFFTFGAEWTPRVHRSQSVSKHLTSSLSAARVALLCDGCILMAL